MRATTIAVFSRFWPGCSALISHATVEPGLARADQA